jgi:hypothetical protein
MASTGAEVFWTFEVDGVEKGRERERIKVASAADEAACGYEFELGKRYRVLASKSPAFDRASTGLGSGNQDLEPLAQVPTVEGSYYAVSLTLRLPVPILIGVPIVRGLDCRRLRVGPADRHRAARSPAVGAHVAPTG